MTRCSARASVLRTAASIALIAFLLSMAAACSRGSQSMPASTLSESDPAAQTGQSSTPRDAPAPAIAPTETPTPTPPSGTVTIWHSWAQKDGDALDAVLQDLREQCPSVKIETLFVAQNDLLQSYAQAVADGSGPDVVLAPNWWLNELATLGVVSPLQESVYDEALSGAWAAAVDNLRIDGQVFGAPTNFETVALYYNKALIQEDALPQSLDDLYQAAQQNPQHGIGIYANPFHVAWGFPAFGAEIFDDAGHAVLDQTGGAAQFLQWLAAVDALEGSYVNPDYGMLIDRFKRGEYAFLVDGPWSLSELTATLGANIGVTVIPPGPGGDARPWLYADAAYVNPNLTEEQAQLAALVVNGLASSRNGEQIAAVAGRLPAHRDADMASDPLLSGFSSQAATADAMPHGAEMDAFWRYGGDMILKALTGVEDMQSVVAEAAALTNDASGK